MSGIKRWDIDCHSMEWMQVEDGDMVKFSDHAAEIARLRAELDNAAAAAVRNMSLACEKEREADALRADAERWNWIMSNYYGGDLTRTQKIIGQCWTREQMEAAIDNDLAERNQEAAMGASA